MPLDTLRTQRDTIHAIGQRFGAGLFRVFGSAGRCEREAFPRRSTDRE